MSATISRARRRLVLGLIVIAAVVPALLAVAKAPRYWEWIALELTPMTWVQTVLLMLTAVGAAAVAIAERVRGVAASVRRPYWLLALGFVYLAVDDRFAIHERIRDGYLAPRDVSLPGLGFLAPGDVQMILMGLAGLLVLPLVLRALRRDRMALRLFVAGVAAAALSLAVDAVDPESMSLATERLVQTSEEVIELLAACLFCGAIGVRVLALLDPVSIPTQTEATLDVVPAEASPELV